jgi:hypothetical protein
MTATEKLKAAVICSTDDPQLQEFVSDFAFERGLAFESIRRSSDVFERVAGEGSPASNTALFLLSSKSIRFRVIDAIHAIRRIPGTVGKVVVYAPEEETSANLALDCVDAGASDYFVRSSYNFGVLKQRLNRLLTASRVYPQFSGIPDLANHSVFIASSFEPQATGKFLAVEEALRRVRARLAKADIPIPAAKIRREIDNSELIIANISDYGSQLNPNVYFEIGYAMASGKRVILVRHRASREPPTDLRAIQSCEYANSADLALQLYYGLRRDMGA